MHVHQCTKLCTPTSRGVYSVTSASFINIYRHLHWLCVFKYKLYSGWYPRFKEDLLNCWQDFLTLLQNYFCLCTTLQTNLWFRLVYKLLELFFPTASNQYCSFQWWIWHGIVFFSFVLFHFFYSKKHLKL